MLAQKNNEREITNFLKGKLYLRELRIFLNYGLLPAFRRLRQTELVLNEGGDVEKYVTECFNTLTGDMGGLSQKMTQINSVWEALVGRPSWKPEKRQDTV